MSQPMHQPDPSQGYSWEEEGRQNRGGSGLFVTSGSSDMVVMTPSWKRTETCYRPYPRPINPADSNSAFEPMRLVGPDGNVRFSNWIRRYNCAWKIGTPSTTFLIPKPAGAPVFDPNQSPLGVLFRAISDVVKKGQARPEWPPLLMGSAGKGKQLTMPKRAYLTQGACFKHNDKKYFGNQGGQMVEPLGWGGNPPLLMLLSGGLGDDVVQQLMLERENYRGNPADFNARFVHPDVLDLEDGRFLHFFEKGSAPHNRYGSQPVNPMGDDGGGWAAGNAGGQAGGGQGGFDQKGYDLFIDGSCDQLKPKIGAQFAGMVRQKWREWNNVLFLPTEAEQAAMLANCFPPSAVVYAFEGHSDWLTKEIRQKAAAAVSASVPGYGPPPGGYQMPAMPGGYAPPGYAPPGYVPPGGYMPPGMPPQGFVPPYGASLPVQPIQPGMPGNQLNQGFPGNQSNQQTGPVGSAPPFDPATAALTDDSPWGAPVQSQPQSLDPTVPAASPPPPAAPVPPIDPSQVNQAFGFGQQPAAPASQAPPGQAAPVTMDATAAAIARLTATRNQLAAKPTA